MLLLQAIVVSSLTLAEPAEASMMPAYAAQLLAMAGLPPGVLPHLPSW